MADINLDNLTTDIAMKKEEKLTVSVSERERERERETKHVCVRELGRERVFDRERERERDKVCERENEIETE